MRKWASTCYTETGKVRSVNEDSVFASDHNRLWGVADGMGGHDKGDYASRYVTSELLNYKGADTPGVALARINRYLAHCNAHLVNKAESEHHKIIGCTVALLYIHGMQAHCVWSGDSRIYRLRDTHLRLLTRDHNYESMLEDSDITISRPRIPGAGQKLTSAIGGDPELQAEHCCYTINKHDQFLICTDGLYNEITDREILQTLYHAQNKVEPVQALARLYQKRGARDNIGMVHIFTHN